tara:strand:- start:270 stop:422 length:153 start_codon:yes stop_codon:yes gene_type:complete
MALACKGIQLGRFLGEATEFLPKGFDRIQTRLITQPTVGMLVQRPAKRGE